MNTLQRSIQKTNNWYRHPAVLRMLLQMMGVENFQCDYVHGDFYDNIPVRLALEAIRNEYIVVRGEQILQEKGRYARSITPWEYLYYLNFENPAIETAMSFWPKEIHSRDIKKPKNIEKNINIPIQVVPNRGIFYIDIEYSDNDYPGRIVTNQEECFAEMEPAYQIIKNRLNSLGIQHLAIKTGKGYNFISQIPCTSETFWRVIEHGQNIEPSIFTRNLLINDRKRHRPVPPASEASFRFLMRLSQYLFLSIIETARKVSRIKIEFSDIHRQVISFDCTQFLRPIDTASLGLIGLYLKWLAERKKIGEHIIDNTPIPFRTIRSISNHEYFDSIKEMVEYFFDADRALYLIERQSGEIPDGSAGIGRLIDEYQQSKLCRFHQEIDRELPAAINREWLSLHSLRGKDRYIDDMLNQPNPMLLQPGPLNYLINKLMDLGEPPVNIALAIAKEYCDPQYNWGDQWYKYVPSRHALGWVSILGGQRYS